MACAGAGQADQGVFERGVVGLEGIIQGVVFWYDMAFIICQHSVKKRFLLLNLLHQGNHGIVIRSNNMA